MASHIADFMVETSPSTMGLNNYIARELSPHSTKEFTAKAASPDEKEKHVWRLQQNTEARKYQLFPVVDKLSVMTSKSSELEPASTTTATTVVEKPSGTAIRKLKEQSLVRRRKISVPELGPMTTVQEIAMDSPTIPGRPPLHERSISAPGGWRHHLFGDFLSSKASPVLEEKAEHIIPSPTRQTHANDRSKPRPSSPRQPLSPKSLAPLLIPPPQAYRPRQSSTSRLRHELQNKPEVPPKSENPKDASPYKSPYTPSSSTSNLPLQTPVITPHSAPEERGSTKPWSATRPSHSPSPLGHSRGQSDVSMMQHARGHRRGESEGSGSVINRGRPPKRRADTTPSSTKLPLSRRSPSAEEQQAFATLPSGIRISDASSTLSSTEFDSLRKQAVGQALRFEVLHSKDVDALSRELRGLDERCDYLRKTHRSLRSGRRNLHERICTYLRSPRVAKFSYESILKQEEALSELDSSIDDWVTKLEEAENRRTRVRQKLLEHVAAALMMEPSSPSRQTNSQLTSLIRAVNGENTPPRSPTKRVGSPVFEMERVVEEVSCVSPEPRKRERMASTQSIKIYADSDVFALLDDVEQELSRMGETGETSEVDMKTDEVDANVKQARNNDVDESRKDIDVLDSSDFILSSATYELPARTYTPPVPYKKTSTSSLNHHVAIRN